MGLFIGDRPIEALSGIVAESDASNIKYNNVATGLNAINVQEAIDETIANIDTKVNVKRYGAIGDGIADDTAAIQAAINSDNPVIYIPDGTYMISSNLIVPSNKSIIGNGDGTVVKLVNDSGNVDMFYSIDTENVSVENLTIDGNKDGYVDKTAHTTCIHFTSCANLKLKRLKILNSLIEGIYAYKCDNAEIHEIFAFGNGYYQADASGVHTEDCKYGNVSNIISQKNGFHGVIITGCTRMNYSNIVTKNNGWDGLRVQWESCNNVFTNIQSQGNFRGIYFLNLSSNNLLSTCTFSDNIANGINLSESTGNQFVNVQANNNGSKGLITVFSGDNAYAHGLQLSDNANGAYDLISGSEILPLPTIIE